MSSIGKLMKQAARMQQQMEQIQAQLAAKTVEAYGSDLAAFFGFMRMRLGLAAAMLAHAGANLLAIAPTMLGL